MNPNPIDLVETFANSKERFEIYCELRDLGIKALPAIREGLNHENWHVRHWCAISLDRHCDEESLRNLVPLLNDPVSKVRLWAVHSICCEHTPYFVNPIDIIPLLIDRIQNDERVIAVLKNVLNEE